MQLSPARVTLRAQRARAILQCVSFPVVFGGFRRGDFGSATLANRQARWARAALATGAGTRRLSRNPPPAP